MFVPLTLKEGIQTLLFGSRIRYTLIVEKDLCRLSALGDLY